MHGKSVELVAQLNYYPAASLIAAALQYVYTVPADMFCMVYPSTYVY